MLKKSPQVLAIAGEIGSPRACAVSLNTVGDQHTTWTAIEARPLQDAQALLATLVVHHGFDLPESWLS